MEVLGGSPGKKWSKRNGETGEERPKLPLCPSCLDVESVGEEAWESCLALGESRPCDFSPALLPSRTAL